MIVLPSYCLILTFFLKFPFQVKILDCIQTSCMVLIISSAQTSFVNMYSNFGFQSAISFTFNLKIPNSKSTSAYRF